MIFRSARWVALGGVLGSLLRWALSSLFNESRSGTLAANLIGVALASFFLVAMEHRGSESMRHFLLPGFCGGLTTFSALAFQSIEPSNGGLAYLAISVVTSLAVVAICLPLARKTFRVSR